MIRSSVKTSTYSNYKTVLKRIVPIIGDIELCKLTPAHLDSFLRELVQQDFARRTIRLTFTVLKEALSYAVYPSELIRSNPAQYVKVPKTNGGRHVERKIISPADFAALMEHTKDTDYRIPLLLLYHTGMRIGEVCGLRWRDVDLNKAVLHVRQQLRHTERHYRITTPKTSMQTNLKCRQNADKNSRKP